MCASISPGADGERARGTGFLRRLLRRLLMVGVSCLVALGLAEIGLRLFWPQIFELHPPGMYSLDPDIGYVLTPDFSGVLARSEFRTDMRTCAAGLRGPEPRPRTERTLRVVCLGDSITYGWGVQAEEAFPALLERKLADRLPGRDLQVLNAGVPGYGNDEELQYLRKRGARLDPDLVVAQFFAGNDFDDNRHPARETHEIRDGMLALTEAGRAAQAQPRWLECLNWLKRRSHVVHLLSERGGYVLMRLGVLGDLEGRLQDSFTEEDAERARELLTAIVTESRSLGADVLLLFVPDKMQVLAEEAPPPRAAAEVERVARETGVGFLDLTDTLRGHPHRLDLYYTEDAHWNPLGHEVVAEALAPRVAETVERR